MALVLVCLPGITVGLEKFTSMKSLRLSRADRDRENIFRELFQFYSRGMNF